MKPLILLRPEPGLSQSAARARALGLKPVLCPLFQVEAVAWQAPDADQYDALPVHAVGEVTARAARNGGFEVASVGAAGVDALLDTLPPDLRLFHPGGEDRQAAVRPIETTTVYRAVAIAKPHLAPITHAVVAVHSPRAGARLADLAADRESATIVAISEAAAAACGSGWSEIAVAQRPDDESMLALAARLCQTQSPR